METKLTIVTTTYNHEKFIAQALDGIVMQKTNFPIEAIISDDCSTDKTREIIKRYAKKYPNIIKPIYNKKNVGAMQNFVDVLSNVKSKYVALCDGDDYWIDANKLQKQVDFLESNLDYSICFHQTSIFFENKSKPDEVYPIGTKEETTFDDLIKECYIPANTVVYRWRYTGKLTIKDVFPKNVVPGDYFVHLLHAEKGKIKFIKEVMSRYRRHEGGMWWLTSQITAQDEFHLKYGEKYINFFEAVEMQFKLSKDIFKSQKNYSAHNTVKCYLTSKKFEELVNFKKEHKDLYDFCINDFNYLSAYENLPRFKKAIYLMLTDNKEFRKKVIDKTKRKLLKVYKKIKINNK